MDIVVVIDILRATSAMVTAFAHGVERIIPVSTIEEARQYIGRSGYIVNAPRREVLSYRGYHHGDPGAAGRRTGAYVVACAGAMRSARSVGKAHRVAPWLLVTALVMGPFATLEEAGAWGFYGHKRINRMACFTLPPKMFAFYKRHIDFVSDHAVDPDRRRYADQARPRATTSISTTMPTVAGRVHDHARPMDDGGREVHRGYAPGLRHRALDTALMECGSPRRSFAAMWTAFCATLRTSATTSPMRMCPCTPRRTTTASSPTSTASMPSGKVEYLN
ncbi:MAG: 2-phosphosulfolactate phosphatase [Flavobacteriales bacterium]|nr:2-phosphosulfolactate phosphatase [Flavobacteriales bacterium]